MSEYKVGDRVRVVLEAVVESAVPGYGIYLNGTRYNSFARDEHIVSVEKVEPPVVTFKPGDVLRGLGVRSLYITLAKEGYVNHQFGRFYPYDGATFTSEYYEKVEL